MCKRVEEQKKQQGGPGACITVEVHCVSALLSSFCHFQCELELMKISDYYKVL